MRTDTIKREAGRDHKHKAAHHGRISKIGRSHARPMLVEAAWIAAKAPGPLHAFFVRIRARRGHQIAAVAGSQVHCAVLAFV